MTDYNPQLSRTYFQEEAIDPYLIVKSGTAADEVSIADNSTAFLLGVTAPDSDDTIDHPVTVLMLGSIAKVTLGGDVTRDAHITATTNGVGVATTTAGQNCVGYALEAGVSGDVIKVLVLPHLYPATA